MRTAGTLIEELKKLDPNEPVYLNDVVYGPRPIKDGLVERHVYQPTIPEQLKVWCIN